MMEERNRSQDAPPAPHDLGQTQQDESSSLCSFTPDHHTSFRSLKTYMKFDVGNGTSGTETAIRKRETIYRRAGRTAVVRGTRRAPLANPTVCVDAEELGEWTAQGESEQGGV